jgi:mRNA-degrading endonuclease HigB of HigAB toxin-antitoxin module
MRIIALRTLREFWEKPEHRDAEQPLKAWHAGKQWSVISGQH